MRHGHAARIGPSKWFHVSSLLLLSCGLTACDPPWSASTDTRAASLTAAETPVASEATAAAPAAVADIVAKAAKGEEPVVEPTPIPVVVELTPMEKAGDPEGNARLAVRYRNAEQLGDVVYFMAGEKREYALKRDEKEPDKYSAMIDFDFDLFAEEQAQRRKDIAEAKLETYDAFEGREWVGEQKYTFLDPKELEVARENSLTLKISPGVIMPPVLPSLDPGKTLMITGLSVVRDPTRTFDICGNYGDPDGAWTFKTLMTNIANPSVTGVDPADFVESWLQSWNTIGGTPNGFAIPARTKINDRVLSAWPRIAGKLDLDQSPMRLLAIVNRVDLRSGSTSSSPYGPRSDTLDAGEGRFVFGVVDRNVNGGCSAMDFTVILEYHVPKNTCPTVRDYAREWKALNGLVLGGAAYNSALESITDQFTAAGLVTAGLGTANNPNGSAISQIRTNEIALANFGYGGGGGIDVPLEMSAKAIPAPPGLGDPWELREFRLGTDHFLDLVPTRKTPHHSLNHTALLANFINSNALAILNGTYDVPSFWAGQPFLTGSTFNFSVADGAVWNAPGIIDQQARHQFSLSICSGCHGGETRNQPADLSFVHIAPRAPLAVSALSRFLVGNGTLSSPGTFMKPDPINASVSRQFGDLRRRRTDLASLAMVNCNPTSNSTSALQEALFARVLDTH